LHNGDNAKPSSWEQLNQLSDEELASELLTGRHDALVVLFDRYHKLVFGVALKIVGDPGEAEEVVQTVFLDIFRALASFDRHRGTLRVWLLQCAYGRSLNRKRHLAAHHFYNSVSLEVGVVEPLSSRKTADIAEASLLMEEIAASGAGMNGCSTMHLTIFGLNTLVKHAAEELRQAILSRRLKPGERLIEAARPSAPSRARRTGLRVSAANSNARCAVGTSRRSA